MIGVSIKVPAGAVVRDRERAARQLVGCDLVLPRTRRQVGDPLRQPGDVQITRVLDHRNQQTLLGVHCNAEMLGIRIGDGSLLGVDRRVQLQVHLQRLDGSFAMNGR